MTRKRKERRKKIKKVEKYCRLRMVIWNFLSVLQRRDRPDRFSSTVTARRDIWLAATVRASRQRTFATEVSTVPTAPTRVAGAVRRSLFVIAPYIYTHVRVVFYRYRCSKRPERGVALRFEGVSSAELLVFRGRDGGPW